MTPQQKNESVSNAADTTNANVDPTLSSTPTDAPTSAASEPTALPASSDGKTIVPLIAKPVVQPNDSQKTAAPAASQLQPAATIRNVPTSQRPNTSSATSQLASASANKTDDPNRRYPSAPVSANIIVAPIATPFDYAKYKQYKAIAEKAGEERKIFTIYAFGYQSLRRALLRRGWRERFLETQRHPLQTLSQHSLLLNAKPSNDYETMAISKLLQPYPVWFLWHSRYLNVNTFDSVLPFKSRMRRNQTNDFTLKDGLVNCAREDRTLQCPRSYRLYVRGETEAFMQDYRFTGCTSLLGFLVAGVRPNGVNERFAENGTIGIKCVDFAMERIREKLRLLRSGELGGAEQAKQLDTFIWREYFRDYHATVREGAKFFLPAAPTPANAANAKPNAIERRNSEWLALWHQCRRAWPHLDTDGTHNMWIMKPAGQSRGNGITVMQDNLRICDVAANNPYKRFIVQKYLERPLLIYNTKFDMRQYFMIVGRASSLQVWMYRTSYLKFSSQEFSLKNFHESVHLTNHSIQKHYANNANRSDKLPANNMWSSLDFQKYLSEVLNKPNAWSKIYAGMKRNVISAVRCAYSEISDVDRNCFELVGADFMVTDAFDVQLLEVNATPDMSFSTSVTRQICNDVQEDCVRVVVDRFHSATASTGAFEMIHEMRVTRNAMPARQTARADVRRRVQPPAVQPRRVTTAPTVVIAKSDVQKLAPSMRSATVAQPLTPPANAAKPKATPTAAKPNAAAPPLAPAATTPTDPTRPQFYYQPQWQQRCSSAACEKMKANSRTILDELATRLLQKSKPLTVKTVAKQKSQLVSLKQHPTLMELDRLLLLNQTIERLLNSRSRSTKYRQSIVTQYLMSRQHDCAMM